MRKTQPRRGSHLPVLMKLVQNTSGPILELGCGIYSTIYLHWTCYPMKRRLVTCENHPRYFDFLRQFECDFHEVKCVSSMDEVDVNFPWSVVLVDHSPEQERVKEIRRLTHADYVVAHDSENRSERKYRYSTIFNLFKYRYKYDGAYPHTTVFSNKYDLTKFVVW